MKEDEWLQLLLIFPEILLITFMDMLQQNISSLFTIPDNEKAKQNKSKRKILYRTNKFQESKFRENLFSRIRLELKLIAFSSVHHKYNFNNTKNIKNHCTYLYLSCTFCFIPWTAVTSLVLRSRSKNSDKCSVAISKSLWFVCMLKRKLNNKKKNQ